MADLLAQTLRDWQSFYILTGTAAATLVGLLFVAASLAAAGVDTNPRASISAFVTPTLIHFGAVLLIACSVTAPSQGPAIVGAVWIGLGAGGLIEVGVAIAHMWSFHGSGAFDHRHWGWHA